MSNFRNWALGSAVILLILIGPIIALLVIIAAEMLSDVLTNKGMTAISMAIAGAIGWVLLRKYRPQSEESRLESEEV